MFSRNDCLNVCEQISFCYISLHFIFKSVNITDGYVDHFYPGIPIIKPNIRTFKPNQSFVIIRTFRINMYAFIEMILKSGHDGAYPIF